MAVLLSDRDDAAGAKVAATEEKVDVVTTSDFVRQFGVWQERALRSPIYILHRGRPRFVMTSVETLRQLCARPEIERGAALAVTDRTLLDLVDTMVLVCDRDLRLVEATASAKRYFSIEDSADLVSNLVGDGIAPLLTAALGRVIATGSTEAIVLPAPRRGRQLHWSIVPYRGGAAMAAHDVTIADDLAAARSAADAADEALFIAGCGAVAYLNVRGHVAQRSPTLARFVGLDEETVVGIKFASLIDRGDRVAVADLIDSVFATAAARAIDAVMLTGGGTPRLVRIGIAPVRNGSSVESVALSIADVASLKVA